MLKFGILGCGRIAKRHADLVPDLSDYGACIRRAVDRHLPYPIQFCAEPGRALVAEAGVLVAPQRVDRSKTRTRSS